MREKMGRYLLVTVLCFSCILLFKSEKIEADGEKLMHKEKLEMGISEKCGKCREGKCDCNGRVLKIYLDARSYIAVDVLLLVVVMGFVFVLVLERR